MSSSDQSIEIADEVAQLVEDRAILIDWVVERLDDLKGDLQNILDGIDPPHAAPRGFDVPEGGESALEMIADAIFAAERRWLR